MEITLGRLEPVSKCAVTVCDEAHDALLQRLNTAIADAYKIDRFTDEVNTPIDSGSKRRR